MSKTIYSYRTANGGSITLTENDAGDVEIIVSNIVVDCPVTTLVTMPYANAIAMNDAVIDHFFGGGE